MQHPKDTQNRLLRSAIAVPICCFGQVEDRRLSMGGLIRESFFSASEMLQRLVDHQQCYVSGQLSLSPNARFCQAEVLTCGIYQLHRTKCMNYS